MKHIPMSILNKRAAFAIMAVIAIISVFGACKKSNDNSGVKQFLGTWRGNSCAHTGVITITSADNNYSLYVSEWVSANANLPIDNCGTSVKLLGMLSSSTDNNNFSMAEQKFTDQCGNNFTLSGGGTLIGDTIYISVVTSSASGTSVCTFKGYK